MTRSTSPIKWIVSFSATTPSDTAPSPSSRADSPPADCGFDTAAPVEQDEVHIETRRLLDHPSPSATPSAGVYAELVEAAPPPNPKWVGLFASKILLVDLGEAGRGS
jgi:hypothetical protein